MPKPKTTIQIITIFFLMVLTAIWAINCNLSSHKTDEAGHEGHDHAEPAEAVPGVPDDHGVPDKTGHEGHDHAEPAQAVPDAHDDHAAPVQTGHEGHDHGSNGAQSDLDKPVNELFSASCEHRTKTYKCAECRYEVGVVIVSRNLIDQGLIKTGKVTPRDFDTEIALTGEISFDQRKIAHISSRASGVVRRVNVDMGSKVHAGQVLVVLESVELAEAKAAYLEALAEQRLANKALDRQKALWKQKITSEREFLESEQMLEAARIKTTSAKQKLLRLGLTSGDVKALAKAGHAGADGRLPVTAPFAGEVIDLHASRGEGVETGDELLIVGDTRTLWVWVDLYESQLALVKDSMNENGLPVTLSVRAWPDARFTGRVDFVSRTMDEATHTVKARVTLDNLDGKLKPGMFANVKLGIKSDSGKLSAPSSAVSSDEGRDFVFVHYEGDFFVRRPVVTGRESGGFVELLEGTEKGQTIVVDGTFLLKSDVLRSKMGAGCAH